MSLPSTTVWEVRTTGSDSNGGGFNAARSGTDYSQQNAAQFSGTDLAIDGTTTTKVTSSSHSFVAADCGNIIHVTAGTGFTVGFYEVVSVSSGAATLDRAVGTAGSTGGTWALGGALATPWSIWANSVCNDEAKIWVKSGTYTLSANVTIVPRYLWVSGYDSIRGDGGSATLQMADSATYIMYRGDGTYWYVQNIVFEDAKAIKSGILCYTGNNQESTFDACVFRHGICAVIGHANFLKNCSIYDMAPGSDAVVNTVRALHNCLVHDITATSSIFYFEARGVSITGNLFYNITGGTLLDIRSYPQAIVSNNTIVGSAGSAMVGVMLYHDWVTGRASQVRIQNNIFYRCSYAIEAYTNNDTSSVIRNNAYMACTSGFTAIGTPHWTDMAGNILLTQVPFTDIDAADYSLNNVTGGGKSCRGAGCSPAGIDSAIDIGAVQHADAGGVIVVEED